MKTAQITRKKVEAIIYLSVDSLMFDNPIQFQADVDACMSNYIKIVQDEAAEKLPEYEIEWTWEIVSDTGYYSDKFWNPEGEKDEYFEEKIGQITRNISQDSSRWYVGGTPLLEEELETMYINDETGRVLLSSEIETVQVWEVGDDEVLACDDDDEEDENHENKGFSIDLMYIDSEGYGYFPTGSVNSTFEKSYDKYDNGYYVRDESGVKTWDEVIEIFQKNATPLTVMIDYGAEVARDSYTVIELESPYNNTNYAVCRYSEKDFRKIKKISHKDGEKILYAVATSDNEAMLLCNYITAAHVTLWDNDDRDYWVVLTQEEAKEEGFFDDEQDTGFTPVASSELRQKGGRIKLDYIHEDSYGSWLQWLELDLNGDICLNSYTNNLSDVTNAQETARLLAVDFDDRLDEVIDRAMEYLSAYDEA
jgi:hypothetical protein